MQTFAKSIAAVALLQMLAGPGSLAQSAAGDGSENLAAVRDELGQQLRDAAQYRESIARLQSQGSERSGASTLPSLQRQLLRTEGRIAELRQRDAELSLARGVQPMSIEPSSAMSGSPAAVQEVARLKAMLRSWYGQQGEASPPTGSREAGAAPTRP